MATPMNQILIPESAGTGVSTVKTMDLPKNSSISSSGTENTVISGIYKNLGAIIKNINGYDILNFSIEPGASFITNQETMSYMDGGLVTSTNIGNSGKKGTIADASFYLNLVSNPTPQVRKITLSPLLEGSIVQINIKNGERWRFSDRSFLACTPNLTVSGDLNIFKNFRLAFVGENKTYTTVAADKDSDGIVWISSFGTIVKHEIDMGTADTVPLFINNGCFLGMLDHDGKIDYWKDYVDIGTANNMFSALFTQLNWVMKIQDTNPPKNASPVRCIVLTQTQNPHNFERYVANIANAVASNKTLLTSGYGSEKTFNNDTSAPGNTLWDRIFRKRSYYSGGYGNTRKRLNRNNRKSRRFRKNYSGLL